MRILLHLILFSGFLLKCTTGSAQPEILRVEPPFWWVDMKQPSLQVMVYGREIGNLQPVIEDSRIELEEVSFVPNKNYLFINFQIMPGSVAGDVEIRFTDKGKTVLTIRYPLKERDLPGEEYLGFDQSDVIYLVTPDRFANGDPTNDNVDGMIEQLDRSYKGGRHGGDLRGLIDHLDYIYEMGFTAVWLNPILENNQEKYSYHGYSTTDFYKVDPRYGSNELYLEFIEEAGKRGVKVIKDIIVNHCGSGHWWMVDLPDEGWINMMDDFHYTNHRRETIQDPYASKYDTRLHSDGWFDRTMPDLNQRHPVLAQYLIQNSIWWIEYAKLGGIRMDTYPYPDKDFMTEWTRRIMDEYPNFNIVGEEWSDNAAIIAFWQRGKQNPNGYRSYLKTLMDFPTQIALARSLNEPEHKWSNDGLRRLYVALANDFLYPNPYDLVVFGDNHDMMRIYSQLNEDFALWKMAMAYLATIRGIPQIYYGTEILMSSTDDHGIIRTDFPGGWEGDQVDPVSGQGLTPQQLEAQTYLRRLLNWRKTADVVHHGQLMHFAPEEGVYVLSRYNTTKMVLTILNKNSTLYELNLDRFQELLNGSIAGTDIITNARISFEKGIVSLQPMSATILEIRN